MSLALQQRAHCEVGVAADHRGGPRLMVEQTFEELPSFVDAPIPLNEMARLNGNGVFGQSSLDTLQARLRTVVVLSALRNDAELPMPELNEVLGQLV